MIVVDSSALITFAGFDKAQQTKAQLNLADCAAHALAETKNARLLLKSNDFSKIDVGSLF